MNTLKLVIVSALTFSLTSCIPLWGDDTARRGPEDFEVTGTLTRTLADCSTTYDLSNVGDAAPSCYKCTKFETGATSAPLAFVLSLAVAETSCEQPLLLGSTPFGFSESDSGDTIVHMFDWTEPKSFAAWKDLGPGTMTGDPYIGAVSADRLNDPVTQADELALDISWDVDEALSRALAVCPSYDGEETEVSYSWLGDGGCDDALNCPLYSFDGGDCDPIAPGDDDDSVDPPQCQDDPNEDNDTPDDATQVPPDGNMPGLQACNGDRDWYVLQLAAGQSLQVDLIFTHGEGDVDARLFTGDLTELAQGVSGDDNESLVWTATQSGPVLIEVFLWDADPSPGNGYSMFTYIN